MLDPSILVLRERRRSVFGKNEPELNCGLGVAPTAAAAVKLVRLDDRIIRWSRRSDDSRFGLGLAIRGCRQHFETERETENPPEEHLSVGVRERRHYEHRHKSSEETVDR
jgi:hypothetical protein